MYWRVRQIRRALHALHRHTGATSRASGDRGTILKVPQNSFGLSVTKWVAPSVCVRDPIVNILCLHAAKDLDRPVKWTGDRSEHFMADDQARDNISKVQLALDADGKFLAFKVETTANLGAYLTMFGTHPCVGNLGTLAGTYTISAIFTRVTAVCRTHRRSGRIVVLVVRKRPMCWNAPSTRRPRNWAWIRRNFGVKLYTRICTSVSDGALL